MFCVISHFFPFIFHEVFFVRLFRVFGTWWFSLLEFVDFFGKPNRQRYISLPSGDAAEGMCGIFDRTMYGTREAPKCGNTTQSIVGLVEFV